MFERKISPSKNGFLENTRCNIFQTKVEVIYAKMISEKINSKEKIPSHFFRIFILLNLEKQNDCKIWKRVTFAQIWLVKKTQNVWRFSSNYSLPVQRNNPTKTNIAKSKFTSSKKDISQTSNRPDKACYRELILSFTNISREMCN